jgi:hypothetical protein
MPIACGSSASLKKLPRISVAVKEMAGGAMLYKDGGMDREKMITSSKRKLGFVLDITATLYHIIAEG